MKYIVTESESGRNDIFIFPKSIDHDKMMEELRMIMGGDFGRTRVYRKAISAGFISSSGECYGESFTLKLASREYEDTQLYKNQFD